jgi:glucoamylase
MERYISWILRVQNEPDPNGIDVRSEPRFNLPNGDVDTKPWGRPQTDGPALRASTVIQYANILLDAGKSDYVK